MAEVVVDEIDVNQLKTRYLGKRRYGNLATDQICLKIFYDEKKSQPIR